MRVVSLLPSATEVLCAVGGESLLVGRSHECDHPASVSDRPVLTAARTVATTSAEIDAEVRATLDSGDTSSLYHLDAGMLASLSPDVIITQDLCDVCSIDLETVRGIAATLDPVPDIVSLDPSSVWDVLDDLLTVGKAVGLDREAEAAMVAAREAYWSAVDFVNPYVPGPEILFLEWMEPAFVGGHWTPAMIEHAGGRHSLNAAGEKSRQVSPEDIVASQPDRVVICPCGYDLDAIRRELPELRRQDWFQALPAVADGDPSSVMLVDGNQMFNRPGPRLVDAFRWLVAWINDRPEVAPDDFPAVPLPPA
ncbi:MAG: ABC transporter substrate-binding protein [Phycisphaera sp.]|nr:ABC transporter substrate-binding protein [Phycisphaera sp.]